MVITIDDEPSTTMEWSTFSIVLVNFCNNFSQNFVMHSKIVEIETSHFHIIRGGYNLKIALALNALQIIITFSSSAALV